MFRIFSMSSMDIPSDARLLCFDEVGIEEDKRELRLDAAVAEAANADTAAKLDSTDAEAEAEVEAEVEKGSK